MMKWTKLLIVVIMLGGSAVIARAGDCDPPSVEEVCEVVKYGTPGLYGLCIAFCEAQDCEPNLNADDPWENCPPGSERVLANYRRKMESGDPDMPCLQAPCPCWTEDELATLMYPRSGDFNAECVKDLNSSPFNNWDQWTVYRTPADTLIIRTAILSGQGPVCWVRQSCSSGDCTYVNRLAFVSPDEFATCEAQLNQAGYERGFDCFE